MIVIKEVEVSFLAIIFTRVYIIGEPKKKYSILERMEKDGQISIYPPRTK